MPAFSGAWPIHSRDLIFDKGDSQTPRAPLCFSTMGVAHVPVIPFCGGLVGLLSSV